MKQGGYTVLHAYQKHFDDIDDALETFRTEIYFNAKKEIVEHHQVLSRIISLEEKEKENENNKSIEI